MLDPHKVPLPLSDRHKEWFQNNNMAHHLAEGGVIHERMTSEGVAPSSEDESPDYDGMTVAQLKAEIERRNQDYAAANEDLLPTTGKKDDLVAILVEDDEAIAESSA